ncbi:hypothetical protein CkaCkLH20_06883 [Colletotrichum karsti]|uniref:Carcinoembryonic antigen-related cell adhesion molecule 1 n=1 Tax=Colletotrichum karsti TaxID=1095194 RepID=A0A9P6I205_9PEZI|nr:uncharacterized protein CkaCkLH20_06883 [Colletotrichum karsti]KAF9875502.1 hypothetical protein CkaCkLH20_06883 [Colletotrichum karsti]
MHLYSSLILSGAAVLVQAGGLVNENYLPARHTPPSEGIRYGQGTSPVTTPAPKIRFRNANLVPRASPDTCGFLQFPISTGIQEYYCVSTTCVTSGSYFGCTSEPFTACYDGTARICQTGRLGSKTRCCTQSVDGWRPWCVAYRMTDLQGTNTLIGCYNTMLDGMNTNSIFLVSETSLISRLSSISSTPSRTPTPTSSTTPITSTSSISIDVAADPTTLDRASTSSTPASSTTSISSTISIDAESDTSSTTDTPASSSAPVGAIVGGVIGGIAVIGLGVFAIVWLVLRRKRASNKNGPPPPPNQPETSQPFIASPFNQQPHHQQQQPQYQPQQQPSPPQQSQDHASKMYYQQQHSPTSPLPAYNQTSPVNGGGGMSPSTYEVPAVNTKGTGNNAAEMSA